MQRLSLSIAGLHDEFQRLRPGRCYWLACDRALEAEALCRTALGGLDAGDRAALVTFGSAPGAVLDALPAQAGPGALTSFQVPQDCMEDALRCLTRDLDRALRPVPPLVAVSMPAALAAALSDAALRDLVSRLQAWADERGTVLLLASHGDGAGLVQRLLPFNDRLGGLVQAYAEGGSPHLLLHYWTSELGVYSLRDLALAHGADGRLALRAEASTAAAFGPDANDQRLYLAHAEVLEGAPALSPGWHLFDDVEALVGRAAHAQAASVLLSIHGNSQVESLVDIVYRLRRARGNALKLVIREMAPCLRYADERLLLDCGASLIVPYGTPLARFLTLIESVQGMIWRGTLPDDPAGAAKRYRPPQVGGVVAPQAFRRLVESIGFDPGGGVEHALLALQPVEGLDASQALGQCVLRRQGDLACVDGGRACLFLFACRRDAVERALDNLFRLPWRELFVGYRLLGRHDLDALASEADMPPSGAAAAEAVDAEAARDRTVLAPRPIRLEAFESA